MPTRFDPRERPLGSLLGNRVSQWNQLSLIKSIQQVSISNSGGAVATATITAVVMLNTILIFGGNDSSDVGSDMAAAEKYVALTNATTVTCTGSAVDNGLMKVTVIEFQPGVLKSVQRGLLTLTSASTAVTITAVNVNKSTVAWLGQKLTTSASRSRANLVLTNATTVTGALLVFADNTVVSYEVWEFF